jgi:Asp-tRNA(Asn)/Glu-tRNA(Gln) amidotransferase A subunit family amidase
MLKTNDPAELTASEAAQEIESGSLSATALMESLLARVAEREGVVKAWAHLDKDQALASARANDASGSGPLKGIPLGVKDIIDTANMPSRYGSPIYKDNQTRSDATCVQLVRNAGGVIMGKTVTTEFAARGARETTNPHNPKHTPGGSSSGSAAAVAAFMVPLAFGTQTIGSVLRPASYCGVYGYKPTYGEFGLQGVKENTGTLDTVGLFARSVEDISLLRSGMLRLGNNPLKSPDISSLRIGFCRTPVWSEIEDTTAAMIEEAAVRLSKVGATVEDLTLDEKAFEESRISSQILKSYSMHRGLAWEIANHHDEISTTLRETYLKNAGDITHSDWRKSLIMWEDYRRKFSDETKDYDIMLTASALGEALEGLDATGSPIMNDLATRTHIPAISIPAFTGPKGLPVGAQLMGHWGEDHKFLEAAKTVASVLVED